MGFISPANVRFVTWVPWTGPRFKLVIEDVRSLLRLRVPDHPTHIGLSGLVQALGLIVFLWPGGSGLSKVIAISPGVKRQAGRA